MHALKRYAKVEATTASNEKILITLLETVLRNIRIASEHLDRGDYPAAAPLIGKASKIVLSLHGVLRPGVEPKLVDLLTALYTFTSARLTMALCTKDARYLREAEKVFAPVVDGFTRAVQMNAAGTESGGGSRDNR